MLPSQTRNDVGCEKRVWLNLHADSYKIYNYFFMLNELTAFSSTCKILFAVLSQSNCIDHSKALCDSLPLSSLSPSTLIMELARASTLLVTSKPPSLFLTVSRSPGTSAAIVGVPQALASTTTKPTPSRAAGKNKRPESR